MPTLPTLSITSSPIASILVYAIPHSNLVQGSTPPLPPPQPINLVSNLTNNQSLIPGIEIRLPFEPPPPPPTSHSPPRHSIQTRTKSGIFKP